MHPLLLLGLLPCLVVLVEWALSRWRLRHIPGPWSWPLLGDLRPLVTRGIHEYCLECQGRYGKLFKVYMGSQPLVVVADPELSKRMTMKNNARALTRRLAVDVKDDLFNTKGLASANGEEWRTLRLAWQPTFTSHSLEGYSDLMDEGAHTLAQHLRRKGESGEVVEVWRALGQMTLAVVGSTAYGTDFHTLPEDGAPASHRAEGAQLQTACETLFAAMGLRSASIYQFINIVFPWTPRLVGRLASAFPDERFREVLEARSVVRNLSMSLIHSWRKAHPEPTAAAAQAAAPPSQQQQQQPALETIAAIGQPGAPASHANGSAAAAAAAPAPSSSSAHADAMRALRGVSGKGVHPGSFMGLMLAARQKGGGSFLGDEVIAAQSNTFILAGYETTANTLCYCIYNIATHPEAQDRLLAEVDAYGRERKVAYADLQQFPFTEAIVRETLRLFPPATLLNRHVESKAGFMLTPSCYIPPNTTVMAFLYGYQRSEEYWPQAAAFKPERWLPEGAHLAPTTPDAWTPFGTGPRMCVGWRFALQEAVIALVRLFQQQTYELLPGQVPLQLQQNLTLCPRNGLRVRVVPRVA